MDHSSDNKDVEAAHQDVEPEQPALTSSGSALKLHVCNTMNKCVVSLLDALGSLLRPTLGTLKHKVFFRKKPPVVNVLLCCWHSVTLLCYASDYECLYLF